MNDNTVVVAQFQPWTPQWDLLGTFDDLEKGITVPVTPTREDSVWAFKLWDRGLTPLVSKEGQGGWSRAKKRIPLRGILEILLGSEGELSSLSEREVTIQSAWIAARYDPGRDEWKLEVTASFVEAALAAERLPFDGLNSEPVWVLKWTHDLGTQEFLLRDTNTWYPPWRVFERSPGLMAALVPTLYKWWKSHHS